MKVQKYRVGLKIHFAKWEIRKFHWSVTTSQQLEEELEFFEINLHYNFVWEEAQMYELELKLS